ncbi:hypothetical protein TWF679_000296 [Orbilia oligospora]|uniref:Uncharacterized protein n=1 Tax=Orbilia oligospora TaxID=2813651 RepID=A0A8H8VNM4_ORBOL|nr:hypothetical protein TWF679_000296 [Orbilia oligospora]
MATIFPTQIQSTPPSREASVEVSARYRSKSIVLDSKAQLTTFFTRWGQFIISVAVFLVLLAGTVGIMLESSGSSSPTIMTGRRQA